MKLTREEKTYLKALKLKVEEKKFYSSSECEENKAYIFENYDEFKSYFIKNGYNDIDYIMLELCTLKITSKDRVIALKSTCDHAITKRLILKHQGCPEFGSSEMTESLEKEKAKFEHSIIKRKDFKLLTDDFKHHV